MLVYQSVENRENEWTSHIYIYIYRVIPPKEHMKDHESTYFLKKWQFMIISIFIGIMVWLAHASFDHYAVLVAKHSIVGESF